MLEVPEQPDVEQRDDGIQGEDGADAAAPRWSERDARGGRRTQDSRAEADVEDGCRPVRPAPAGVRQHQQDQRGTEHSEKVAGDGRDRDPAAAEAQLGPPQQQERSAGDREVLRRHEREERPAHRRPPASFLQGGEAVGDGVEQLAVLQR